MNPAKVHVLPRNDRLTGFVCAICTNLIFIALPERFDEGEPSVTTNL